MRFELIGLQHNIWLGTDKKYEPEWYDWDDQIQALFKASDIARVTFEDGTKMFLGKANFNLGKCNCCDGDQEVKMYEFFRVVNNA
jgi:hypothetical protein